MRNPLSGVWNYLKFFWAKEPQYEQQDGGPELFGIKLKTEGTLPKNKVLLYDEKTKQGVIINIADEHQIDEALTAMDRWAKENEEIKILSTSIWSEGKKCDHTYKKVRTSKEHGVAIRAQGVHKDYVCSKCGHSFCGIVSEDSRVLAGIWTAMLSKVEKGSV